MKTVAIVQARMGSTRLPGKVLLELAGEPMLAQLVRRLHRSARLDEVVIATSVATDDDRIAEACRALGVRCFRGSERDVLSRYAGAAREVGADVVVRVTADCPLIEPAVIDRVVDALHGADGPFDYATNTYDRTFPHGLDCEALYADTLARMHRMARSPAAREHVTVFIRERPDLFVVRRVADDVDNADLRWTVDTPEDLAAVRAIYDALGLADSTIDYRAIVRHVRAHPRLTTINAHVQQKPYWVAQDAEVTA